MEDGVLAWDLKCLRGALDIHLDNGIDRQTWFISFGSLLYLIRDRLQGKPYEQDVDISIVGPHRYDIIENTLLSDGFTKKSHIKNDITDEVLYAEFQSSNGLNVDLFFWIEHNGKLWHTYDYMANAEKGIPEKYHFKGVPKELMTNGVYKIRWFREMEAMNVPKKYGSLLDFWYPNWYIPDSEFGVSYTPDIVEPKTCKNLETELK